MPRPRKKGFTPDFTCPSRTICLFSGSSWNGTHFELTPSDWANHWYTFSQAGVSPNPGSINDNTGSAVWVYAKDNGERKCMGQNLGDQREKLGGAFGWFCVTYGDPNCATNPPGPLP